MLKVLLLTGETSEDMARMLRMKENLEKAMKDLEDQQKTGKSCFIRDSMQQIIFVYFNILRL